MSSVCIDRVGLSSLGMAAEDLWSALRQLTCSLQSTVADGAAQTSRNSYTERQQTLHRILRVKGQIYHVAR